MQRTFCYGRPCESKTDVAMADGPHGVNGLLADGRAVSDAYGADPSFPHGLGSGLHHGLGLHRAKPKKEKPDKSSTNRDRGRYCYPRTTQKKATEHSLRHGSIASERGS